MRIRHKILLLFLSCLVACALLLTFLSFFAYAKIKNGLTYFHSNLATQEGIVESLDFYYDSIGLNLPFGIKGKGVELNIIFADSKRHVLISTEKIEAEMDSIPSGMAFITAKNINIVSASIEKPMLSNQYAISRIEVDYLTYQTRVSLTHVEDSMRSVYQHLSEILARGDTQAQLELEGTLYFKFQDRELKQRFRSISSETLTRLVLNRDDLESLAPQFADRVSIGDLDLIASHPIKAPRMLEIRQEAEAKTRSLKWSEKNLPEDAYRHILWAYLLTKEYGEDFAFLATNAHEEGSYNTPEEITRDRTNNMLGIKYATEGVSEDQIHKIIHSDHRVIR